MRGVSRCMIAGSGPQDSGIALQHTPIRGHGSSDLETPADTDKPRDAPAAHDSTVMLPLCGDPWPVLPLRRLSSNMSQTLLAYGEAREAKAGAPLSASAFLRSDRGPLRYVLAGKGEGDASRYGFNQPCSLCLRRTLR